MVGLGASGGRHRSRNGRRRRFSGAVSSATNTAISELLSDAHSFHLLLILLLPLLCVSSPDPNEVTPRFYQLSLKARGGGSTVRYSDFHQLKSATMDEQQEPHSLASTFPNPPDFWKAFTPDRIAKIEELRRAHAADEGSDVEGADTDVRIANLPEDLITLQPPPEPADGRWRVFGDQYMVCIAGHASTSL